MVHDLRLSFLCGLRLKPGVMLCKSSIVLCCVLIVIHHGGPLDAAEEEHDGVVVKRFTNKHNGDHYTFS